MNDCVPYLIYLFIYLLSTFIKDSNELFPLTVININVIVISVCLMCILISEYCTFSCHQCKVH